MAHFACYCRDNADSAATRQSALAEHLAHVQANIGRYLVAGPLKDGEAVVGSLLVIEADDCTDARSFIECDPYFAAGVWRSIDVEEFLGVAGTWVGGAAW